MNKDRPLSRKNPLKVKKESHKITNDAPLPKPMKPTRLIPNRMAIYSVPQGVIQVTAQNFKDVVQSLTGNGQPTAPSEASPAARLASTERTASKKKEKLSCRTGDDDMMRMLDNGVQMSQFPGILLPEPATSQPFPSENFLSQTPSDIFSSDPWPMIPSDNFSAETMPPTRSDILTTDTWPPIPPDFFSGITWPVTPTDTFLQDTFPMTPSGIFSPGTWTPETLQQRRAGVFSPILSPQSQTVVSYNDVWPENNAFAKPSEFLSPEVSSPQSPPMQFNPFDYN
ncbi:unnamed protein product [Lathyrus sativus]|nr:unnamed protein product [Lathyrus sativus]